MLISTVKGRHLNMAVFGDSVTTGAPAGLQRNCRFRFPSLVVDGYSHSNDIGSVCLLFSAPQSTVADRDCCNVMCKCSGPEGTPGRPGETGIKVSALHMHIYTFIPNLLNISGDDSVFVL